MKRLLCHPQLTNGRFDFGSWIMASPVAVWFAVLGAQPGFYASFCRHFGTALWNKLLVIILELQLRYSSYGSTGRRFFEVNKNSR